MNSSVPLNALSVNPSHASGSRRCVSSSGSSGLKPSTRKSMSPSEPISSAMPMVCIVSSVGYTQVVSAMKCESWVSSSHAKNPNTGCSLRTWVGGGLYKKAARASSSARMRGGARGRVGALLPGYPVVFPEVARAAPERAVRSIDEDRVDRAGGLRPALDSITHALELGAHPRRRVVAHDEPSRVRRVHAEGLVHLIAVDVRGLDGLLHAHPELDD